MIRQKEIILPVYSRGFHLITDYIEKQLDELPEKGLLHIFILHTSAALTINENFDPSVRHDLNEAFDQLIKENEPYYTHTAEGPDDMPAHIKSSLLQSFLLIPIANKKLYMGTWQGIYLCEFRNNARSRKLVLTIYS